jgi:hypothetical protein
MQTTVVPPGQQSATNGPAACCPEGQAERHPPALIPPRVQMNPIGATWDGHETAGLQYVLVKPMLGSVYPGRQSGCGPHPYWTALSHTLGVTAPHESEPVQLPQWIFDPQPSST